MCSCGEGLATSDSIHFSTVYNGSFMLDGEKYSLPLNNGENSLAEMKYTKN
jgi:hypothetical protein